MRKHDFSIVYWNIWLEVQNGKRDTGRLLMNRFDRLITDHNPDFFGLNELVVNTRTGESAVKAFLEANGYSVHFVPFSNISPELMVGNALAYKLKPKTINNHVLGPDTQALRRGYPEQTVSLIHGEFIVKQKPLTVIVNYLGNLIPLDWGTHAKHRKNFNDYLKNIETQNIVIGGDFNEPKYLWTWLKTPAHFTRRTGNLLNPTWKLLGNTYAPLQANYDYLLHTNHGSMRLEHFEVMHRTPSDHSPLLAKFTMT